MGGPFEYRVKVDFFQYFTEILLLHLRVLRRSQFRLAGDVF